MGKAGQLTREFDPKFRRDRRLEQEPPPAVPSTKPVDTTPEIREIRDNYQKVAKKAQMIQQEAFKLAIVRNIPVPNTAPDVQVAVRRQDESSGGLFITFDLYRKSYEYLQRQSRVLNIGDLDSLTGDFSTDSRLIQSRVRERVDNITAETAQLLGDQILILFTLHMLMLGQNSSETAKQTAPKLYPGSEQPAHNLQWALSLAALLAQTNITQEQAKQAIEELGGIPPTPDTAGANALLGKSRLFQGALLQKRDADYRLIVNFAHSFLDKQLDPGWDGWQLAPELREIESLCEESADLLSRYDRPGSTTSNEAPANPLEQIAQMTGLGDTPGTNGAQARPEVVNLYGTGLEMLNKQVDQLGYLLGTDLSTDDLCCYLKWLTELGPEGAQAIKTGLSLAQNLSNVKFQIPELQYDQLPSLSTLIHQEAMLLLQDLEDTIVEKISEWLRTDIDSKWVELFQQCGLIDITIEYLMQGIEAIEELLISKLEQYLSRLEARQQRHQKKLNKVGNQKNIRSINLVIDQWQEFGGASGGICPETASEPTQIASAAERVLSGLGPEVVLPTEALDGDRFSVLSSPPLVLDNGIQIPAPPGASAGSTLQDAAQEVCRSGAVRQNLVPFPRG